MSPRPAHSKTHRFIEILTLLTLFYPLLDTLEPLFLVRAAAAVLVGAGLVLRRLRKASWVATLVAGLILTAGGPPTVDGTLLCLFAAFLLFDSGWFGERSMLMAGLIVGAILAAQTASLWLLPGFSAVASARIVFTDGLFLVLILLFRADLRATPGDHRPCLAMRDFDLTTRERQIVHLVWGGETPKQIAGFLQVSEPTVRKSLSRVYSKLQVPGLRELGELVHTHQVIWEEPFSPG